MKVLLYGKNAESIEELVKSMGFEIVTQDPEVIISFGGDGTLIASEREYLGIPKLPIRDSKFCHKCPKHQEKDLLEKLQNNTLQLKTYQKLKTGFEGKTLLALNDFSIRNAHPTHAIRFRVHLPPSSRRMSGSINNNLFIGDGIVVATPFGSSAYFKSISRQTFEKGFGMTFNNITEKAGPLFLEDNDSIEFNLVRGRATLTFDNNPDIFDLTEGSTVSFSLSQEFAKIYEADSLRCPDCQVKRD